MNDILEEIEAEYLRESKEDGASIRQNVYDPEEWCSLLRHQIRLADRAACSLATDEITGAEEHSLIVGYRERLIKIAAVATGAAQSLDRILSKRLGSADQQGDLEKRAEGRARRRLEK